MPASENAQSLKVLDELMQKLTISKEADEIKAASGALASFINGRIEDVDTPTKYVLPLQIFFLNFFSVAFFCPSSPPRSGKKKIGLGGLR